MELALLILQSGCVYILSSWCQRGSAVIADPEGRMLSVLREMFKLIPTLTKSFRYCGANALSKSMKVKFGPPNS
jgi:hypothetical protein